MSCVQSSHMRARVYMVRVHMACMRMSVSPSESTLFPQQFMQQPLVSHSQLLSASLLPHPTRHHWKASHTVIFCVLANGSVMWISLHLWNSKSGWLCILPSQWLWDRRTSVIFHWCTAQYDPLQTKGLLISKWWIKG